MSHADLTFAEQRLLGFAGAAAAESSVASQQPWTITELAELLGLDKESCTRALRALKSRGLLHLVDYPGGRYVLLLAPTP